jgi:hypothetical protein
MVARRQEKYRQAMVKRVTKEAASIDPDVQTPADAAALLLASQYTKLLDQDKPAVEQAAKLVSMMTGATETNSQRANEPTPGTISAAPDTLMELARLIEAERRQAADQARAIDADGV